MIAVAKHVNAHIGKSCDGYEEVHSGTGLGRRNVEGERLLELTEGVEMITSWSKKKTED